MKKLRVYIIAFFIFLISVATFLIYTNANSSDDYIDFSKTKQIHSQENRDTISIAMISVSAGSKDYAKERELAKYIAKKLNKSVKFVQRKSYEEINSMLKNKEVDIVFLSTGAYILYENKDELELIARPNRNGGYYHPVLIANINSDYKTFEQLKGKDFAFVDTYSYSGYIFFSDYLKKNSTSVDEFFNKKYYFTHSHEQSIRQVANSNVEAAVIDDWALAQAQDNHPDIFSNVKVIQKFDKVATGPVVVSKSYDKKEELKEILYNISKDEEIKNILNELKIEGYMETKQEDYPKIGVNKNV